MHINNYASVKKSNVVSAVILSVLVLIAVYVLNYYTPLYADDYSYSFSYLNGERIVSFSQLIDSQIAHYQKVNGRSVVHFLAQLFLLIGREKFNYINTFGFLVLVYLAYFHACGTFKSISSFKLLTISVLLFLSTPAFGQSFLWITGAANYLYGILIILLFLIPYRIQVAHNRKLSLIGEIVTSLAAFVFGVIAGWTNENTSIAMLMMLGGYLFFYHIKQTKIHAWNITGLIGGGVGFCLMLFSPGTSHRLKASGGAGGILAWAKRAVFYTCDMITYTYLVMLLFSIFVAIYIYKKRLPTNKCHDFKTIAEECGVTAIYFLGFLVSVYSMVASPQFPKRAWSGPVILLIVSTVSLTNMVDISGLKYRIGKRITLCALVLLFLATYANAYFDLKNVNGYYYARISRIETAISSEQSEVEIPNIRGWTGYSCYEAYGDLNLDSSEWPNTAIAKYYGVKEIVLKDDVN